MYLIFCTILFLHCLENNQMFQIMGLELNSDELMGYERDELLKEFIRTSATERATWPLQAGYSGLSLKNLNEYVSLFSHCLVNIQNYQGIEIIGIQSPVYITRFDVAIVEVCDDLTESLGYHRTRKFLFGRIPPKSKRNCTTHYFGAEEPTDKSRNARWICRAQFDLFFPEPKEAPHIVLHSQNSGIKNLYITTSYLTSITSMDMNLFDVPPEFITHMGYGREGFSKIP